ncbi:MAG: hypothetical protein U0P81_03525 [Holophagaceae bacterium]
MASGKKILLGIGIGCGVLVLLVGGGCVAVGWWAKKKVDATVSEAKAEMDKNPAGRAVAQAMKEGATRGEGGVTGALTGLAGAGMAMAAPALAMQVVPSLPPSEQAEAKAVFKALADKGARMSTTDLDAYGKAVQRFTEATEPGRKARQQALEAETDPGKKMQMSMDMMKVEPEHARQLVADLKAITDRL